MNKSAELVSYSYLSSNNPIHFNINDDILINASQMANLFGKRPAKWLELPSSKDFILTLMKIRPMSKNRTLVDSRSHKGYTVYYNGLVITQRGGSNPGTWMRQDIALEFARWLSPEFAIWCNDRIKEIIQGTRVIQPVKQLSKSSKYNRQKIDTYISTEDKTLLEVACKNHGFKSTYQLLQHLIKTFLNEQG